MQLLQLGTGTAPRSTPGKIHSPFWRKPMKKLQLALSIAAFGLMAATASLPARADDADLTFAAITIMADKNKDSMITKQEFLDAMGKAYDMKMAKMKAGKDADKMMKGNAMTMQGFKSLLNDIHSGA
jgi:hypothetical protein